MNRFHLLSFLIAFILTACINDSEQCIMSEKVYTLGLKISVGDQINSSTVQSQNHSRGDYQAGDGYENFLDISDLNNADLRLLIYSADDILVTKPKITHIVALSSTNISKTYELRFEFTEAERIAAGDFFKVVMLANWENWSAYPKLSLGSELSEIWANATASFSPITSTEITRQSVIPLYGISQYMGDALRADVVADLGTIHLIRAFAKVQVSAQTNSSNISLKTVEVNRYAQEFSMAPANINHPDNYVHFSWEKDFIPEPTYPGNSDVYNDFEIDNSFQFPYTEDADGKRTFIAYLPEYRNLGRSTDQQCLLTLKFELTNDTDYPLEYTIPFAYYSNPPEGISIGTPHDLLRNNWYKYSITLKDRKIECSTDVIPFACISLNPSFGVDF